MMSATLKSLQVSGWRELYKTALFETDKSKLNDRIADAEMAVVQRARELFHIPGDNIEEESALDDALYALHALRGVAERHARLPAGAAVGKKNSHAA